ncbi:protein kinase domain-containing protein [Streptomyces sp. NPDC000963]
MASVSWSTPQYLSPEQALGKAVDHRSDLYATGCLLYELLSLRPPFTGETPLSVVYQHVQDAPVPPSDVTGSVPPELDGLVMRSLAKDPDDRFQSAEEMRGLIQYALQMLQQQGGYTGTWNTGPIEAHEGGRTPAGGVAATAVMGHPTHGETAQGPILPPMNPDDGGYDGGTGGGGYGQGGAYGPQGGGSGGRGKMWLFAALAVVAVIAGVAFALSKAGGNGGGGTENNKKPTITTSPSVTPSEEPTPSKEPTQDQTQDPGTSTGGSTREPWTEQPTRQPEWPTGTPSTETPTEPTTTPPVEPTDTPTKTVDPTTGPTTPPVTEPTGDPTGGGDGGGDTGDPGTEPTATGEAG